MGPPAQDELAAVARLAASTPGDLEAQHRDLIPTSPGRTLLPSPFANAISLWSRSTSLALRVGTVIGGYGFGAAKATTLSSLELGRGILEAILHRAGNEAFLRSNSDLGRADAESIMEKSLESLHLAMSQVVFWTSAGFHLTGTTLSTITEMSQLTLSYLDSILGSTESSRAIASIITLIRREFNNPATGQPGEKVGVFDLIVGIVGMAYFQRWAWRLIEEENQRLRVEEILWDVAILNDEERIDYSKVADGKRTETQGPNDSVIETIQRHGAGDSSDDDDDLPEVRLKHQIMHALPAGAKVAITTETKTTKTITVDILGTRPSTLPPPPGVELIEETRLRPSSSQGDQRLSTSSDHLLKGPSQPPATYRVVYRVNKNKLRSTEMARGEDEEGEDEYAPRFVEQIDDTDGSDTDADIPSSEDEVEERRPTPPPKSPIIQQRRSSLEPSQQTYNKPRPGRTSSTPSVARRASADKGTSIPVPRRSPEASANQKRPRMPISPPASSTSSDVPRKKPQSMQSVSKLLSKKPTKGGVAPPTSSKSPTEKKGVLRKKGIGSTISNLMAKDGSKDSITTQPSAVAKSKQPLKTAASRGPQVPRPAPTLDAKKQLTVPNRGPSIIPRREAPRPSQASTRNPLTSRALAEYDSSNVIQRSPSRASYISVHERRRDSLISQTDAFSIHSVEGYRPGSPTYVRTPVSKSRQERDITHPPPSPLRNHKHRNSTLYSPSIYTLKTCDSQMSLVPYSQPSLFADGDALVTLRRTGTLEEMFPRFHLLRNITRYMRFSSASYGSHFLKVLGISKSMPPMLKVLDETHQELRSFAHHTQSQPQSILLASFVDPQGGSDSSGSTETGVPLVHYISLDDESKAVVLACRGTLGFEDVLADMTCDYDDLVWRGKGYKVHKGVHASARRLLYGGDGRVLVTIKAALEENPDYGLVLTGHSLGGAVTALLGVMLSEPAELGASFITSDAPHSRLLPSSSTMSTSHPSQVCLPPGRPIHVYAYGPPSTMSPSLCRATRGLITSVVHNQDLVPYLSLGVLHDFQAVALAFKTDNAESKQEIKQRVWEALQGGLMDKWRGNSSSSKSHGERATEEEENWAFAAYKTLRASTMSVKLLPPGEVFIVETEKVLRRDAFLRPDDDDADDETSGNTKSRDKGKGTKYVGRPARRIVLKYVRDVETRFREVRFGATMLTDHSPAKYEDALDGLRFGVVDS